LLLTTIDIEEKHCKRNIYSDTFTTGFDKRRSALEKVRDFDKHLKSTFHTTATQNYKEYMKRCHSNGSIADLIHRSRTELIKQNQEKLKNVYSTVALCTRQLITLGHLEQNKKYLFKVESIYQIQSKIQSLDFTITTFRLSNHVNFLGTIRWGSLMHSLLNCILNDLTFNPTYLSPTIQNEIVNILSDQVR
jgi:hypothetical protein